MKGALSGVLTAWLGLIVLQAVGTSGGSGRISSAFKDANALLERVLDPNVPAIPDLRIASAAAAQGTNSPNYDLLSSLGTGDFAPRPTSNATGSKPATGQGYVRPTSNATASAAGTTAARYNLGRVGGL